MNQAQRQYRMHLEKARELPTWSYAYFFLQLLNGNNQHGQIVIFYAIIMQFCTDILFKLSRADAAEQGLPLISVLLHLRKQPFRQCTRGKDNNIAGKYFAELRFALYPGSL